MAKRLLAAVFSLLLCLVLSGCAGFSYQNINELLRAPALGGGLDEIQKALTADLDGVEPQYKYPKEGDWRGPLLLADLNGDGAQEAVVLYSLPDASSPYVNLALLEQVDGEWAVVQNVEGQMSEVASLETADLLGDGTRQLIVGYSNATLASKTVVLYAYNGQELESAFQRAYSRYEIGDFIGRGGNDLVVVSDEPGSITLEYITSADGAFVTDAAPVALYNNIQSCVNIAPGSDAEGGKLLVVDGKLEDQRLVSQIVYYSGTHFYTLDNSAALANSTQRSNSLLLSRDIDGDGMVETPIRESEIQTPNADKRLEFVRWMDFVTNAEGEARQFGLVDTDRGVYFRLPDGWQGSLTVTDGENKGEWRLQNARTRQTLLSLQVMETNETPPMNSQRVLGSVNSYLVYGSGLTEADRETISMVLMS